MSTRPTIKKLSNGMSVILVPQKGAVSMTLLVQFRVGSRYESKELNGASHFIEHLMFKGTKKRPTSEKITRELDRFGAEYNAYTDKDITGYYIKMDAAQTPLAVDLLHDMLFQSKFDAKELDRERGVICEEINMYEDNPNMHIGELLDHALFGSSTLGWNIAGSRENVRKMSREGMIRYRDSYYIPERCVVTVAGKLIPGLWGLLEKTFGTVKRQSGLDAPYEGIGDRKALCPSIGFQKKPTEQVQLAIGFPGLPMTDADLPAVALLATILGGSMSSRLFVEVRERRGLCYSISASHGAREDIGEFIISAGVDAKRVPEATKAIFGELKKIREKGVTASELRLAKDHIRGKIMLAFEDSAQQAEWYGRQWLFQKKRETPEEKMLRYEKVTPRAIQKAARMLFVPDLTALAIIGPEATTSHVQDLRKW